MKMDRQVYEGKKLTTSKQHKQQRRFGKRPHQQRQQQQQQCCKRRKQATDHHHLQQRQQQQQQQLSTVECLPSDLLVEIMIRLASSSTSSSSSSSEPLVELARVKMTCKQFQEAAEDRLVLARASIDKHSNWRFPCEYSSFLNRCAEAGNQKANFILGLKELLRRNVITNWLEAAAGAGHIEAMYVLGIVYFNHESSRVKGMELFDRILTASGGSSSSSNTTESGSLLIKICRDRVVRVLHIYWGHKVCISRLGRQGERDCGNEKCGEIKNLGLHGWWEPDLIVRSFCSQHCMWTHEFNTFYDRHYNLV